MATESVARISLLRRIREEGIEERFYGYLTSTFEPRGKKYKISAAAPTRAIGRPFDHAVEAARELNDRAEAAGLPVYLCMSGGADSEAMAQAFLAANVTFEVRIARYKNGLNAHDLGEAVSFCKANKVPFRFIEIDLVEHYRSRQPLRHAIRNGCQSPQFSVYMELAQRIGGYPVFSGNPPHLHFDKSLGQYKIYLPKLKDWSFQRHLDSLGGGCAFFFSSTAELTYSFLRSRPVRKLVQERRTMSYIDKIKVYNSSGFRILPRPQKFGGFERVKRLYELKHQHLFHWCYDNMLRWNLDVLGPVPATEQSGFSRKHMPDFLAGHWPAEEAVHGQ